MTADPIPAQLAFLAEADRLKSVDRANVLMDGSRPENTAEHCWHLALWVLVMAEYAPRGVKIEHALALALMHDLVEIDAGDHPIHLPQDAAAIALKERAAADRIFALLPPAQARRFRAYWEEFEAGTTPAARFVRMLDMTQPLYQALYHVGQTQTDWDILRDILTTGRSAELSDLWPDIYRHAMGLLDRKAPALPPRLAAQVRFLAEADRLKSVRRGTSLHDGSRRENSAEHSWHICLFALTLLDHAIRPVDLGTVLRMLILHDLVEIDAGDVPIHSAAARDAAQQAAVEAAAATRIFGLLPRDQGRSLRAIWDTFEAARTDDAIFAKSLDRVQPVLSNLATGGASWVDYNVTRAQIDDRVGQKVTRGAPALWDAIRPEIDDWFNRRAAS